MRGRSSPRVVSRRRRILCIVVACSLPCRDCDTDYACHLSPHIDSFSVTLLCSALSAPFTPPGESCDFVLRTLCGAHLRFPILSGYVYNLLRVANFLTFRSGIAACLWNARLCAHYRRASLYFFFAAAFRSNGILLALYVPWCLLIDPVLLYSTLPRPSVVFHACFHVLLPLLPSSAPRLPRLLPPHRLNQSLTTTLVQPPHTINLHPRPTQLLARQFPFLLDPCLASQHRSRAPSPHTAPFLQRVPHIFTD